MQISSLFIYLFWPSEIFVNIAFMLAKFQL
uniref:Uncharacterized protein n=1 Tax=Rhizophora mucronata TaxID=61149 RepID=A0A2P2IJV9_RHIMU